MEQKFIRVYQPLDIQEVKRHLLIAGDLSGCCSACQALDIPFEAERCPSCHTAFHYLSFRRPDTQRAKIAKIARRRPSLRIIDFQDYEREAGSLKARELF